MRNIIIAIIDVGVTLILVGLIFLYAKLHQDKLARTPRLIRSDYAELRIKACEDAYRSISKETK